MQQTKPSVPLQRLAGIGEFLRHFTAVTASSTPLPTAVSAKTRLMLLDTVACMLAARNAPEVLGLESHLSRLDAGSFQFPGGKPLSNLGAAAVAAMSATWDEACEGLALAHGRPGVPVMAALLPQAVSTDAELGTLLRSIVAGYEVGARAGAWLRIQSGMHVDANWPSLGVASAMSDLLGLPLAARLGALNIAACQLPTSLYLPVASGANARNTYLPHSAWLGVLAASAAAAGVSAPGDALPHYAEKFSAAGEEPSFAADRFLILDAYLKPHAAVRHVHFGAEAARLLRERLPGGAASGTAAITAIRLAVYREAITYCGNRAPRQPIQAQFSLSFGIAAALVHGGIEAGVYREESFHSPELRRLEALVQIEADEALTAAGARGATLVIDAAGQQLEQTVGAIKGDPERPMTEEEVSEKFLRYASCCVETGSARRFAEAVLNGPSDLGMRRLWGLLEHRGAPR
jgi:2-methylcitrate dehydratase PrpD